MALLKGKAVVITGGGRGLGEAYAVEAARAGASVVVNDVAGDLAEQVAERIVAEGGRAVASSQSVRDPDQASAIVERCLAQFGRVDGLVNNAGLYYEAAPWSEKPDAARELIEVNVLGVLYCSLAAARIMYQQCSGSIVNIASDALLGRRHAGTYSASKGAVVSLTYAWAVDFESRGVRVNGVCPLAWTRMVEESVPDRIRCDPDDLPARIAPLVVYLLSDRAAPITGQLIRFTGEELHVVRRAGVKEQVLRKDSWGVEDIASAFENTLRDYLEPFGLVEKRVYPLPGGLGQGASVRTTQD